MKKVIGLILVLSFCFTQTAMVSERGEDAIGIWVSSDIYNIEYSDEVDVDDIYIHFDYKTDFGLEIGFDYDDENERLDLGLAYHSKSNSGLNVWAGLDIYDVEEEFYEIGDALGGSFGIYTNDSVYFTAKHVIIDSWWNETDFTTIEVGKMFEVVDPLVIGISYYTYINDGDEFTTDYLDEGWIKLTLGVMPF